MTYIVLCHKAHTVAIADFQISSLMTHTGQMMKKTGYRLGRVRNYLERSKLACKLSLTLEITSYQNCCYMTPLWGHITLFELLHNKPT